MAGVSGLHTCRGVSCFLALVGLRCVAMVGRCPGGLPAPSTTPSMGKKFTSEEHKLCKLIAVNRHTHGHRTPALHPPILFQPTSP